MTKLRLLISNDDGIHATGINALYSVLAPLHHTVVVAPSEERSTTGHSLSLDKPLRLEQVATNRYACSGFPGDCALMGIAHVMKDQRPDVVLSGINRGANLGQDLYYSGTIAAAREAAFHGYPSIAFSLVLESMTKPGHHYESAALVAAWLLEAGLHKHIAALTLVNVNVPDRPLNEIKGIKLTEIGFRKYSEEIHAREDSRGRDYFWIAGRYLGHQGDSASDCSAVDEGYIAVTAHKLIESSRPHLNEIAELLAGLNAKHFSHR